MLLFYKKKEFILERSSQRKIELEEVQESQTDIQMELKLKAITLDVEPES
jgi:hypothetical protein